MREIICAICKTNKNTKVLYEEKLNLSKITSKTFSARRTPDRSHFKFLKCHKCGLIFSSPIISTTKINSLYSKSRFNYKTESEYLKKTYWKYFSKHIDPKKIGDLKILEIGCGNGFFLEKLLDMGARHVYGIEPGRPSVQKSRNDIRKNIKVSILKKNLFPKSFFDVIVCFHTLDHIVDPNDFLNISKSLLKTKGKVIFIVHNTQGLSVMLFGEKSPIFDIEHVFLFNKQNLSHLLKLNNFKSVKTFDVTNKYPLSYWIYLSPLPLSFKKKLLKFLKRTKIGSLPVSINAGNVGVFASK